MARDRSLDIAVTGISARLPGPAQPDKWWTALTEGRVLTTRYERADLLAAGAPAALVDDPDYVPVRGHLPDADRFDNTLFRVSPREAEMMDPQHRLMLETAWAALEDAGTGPFDRAPTTAVYASASGSGYLRAMVAGGRLDPLTLEDALHGTEPDFMASLISYKLGLTGPAVAVQTACSSSLVAVHMAIQALLSGDCDQALVVAAGIGFPQAGHLHVRGGILSATGVCRPFDESADGVVVGSGVAAVVLRRLPDALTGGPQPYGVILGTAINNDGSAKAGYYAPSVGGQEAVIRAALRAADVDARSVGYLEAHATGTRLGDPIEWAAATAAYGGMGARAGQIAVGAVKANIGHLDNAAGLAGLIKALRVVCAGVLPPVAGFSRINPMLDTEGSPLYIPTTAGPWTGPGPRRAAISSFGIGGTNAHVLVEQAPRREPVRRTGRRSRLVLLSAAGAEAVRRRGHDLAGHLAEHRPDLADVSFTLCAGRAPLPERLAVAGRDADEVAHRLAAGAGVVRGRCPAQRPAPVVFLFPGQGAQYPGMAAPFAEALPGFAAALDRCLAAFDPELAARLRTALYDPAAGLDTTELAQPALFAVEYAAQQALAELGIAPVAVLGHSLGEITAACVAGVFDLPDAARFVAARGRAMQACPDGAMLAVGAGADRVAELIAGQPLELAAINGPDSCVVAGPVPAVTAFAERLGEATFTRRLRTTRAFHSALIEPAVPVLAAELAGMGLHRPVLPFASNLTGRLVPPEAALEPNLFVDSARRPVRFADALGAVARRFPGALMLEVGPGRALSALAEAVLLPAVALCPARFGSGPDEVLTALGALWTQGQPVDVAALCAEGERIHLPTYPFAGPRWIAPEALSRQLSVAAPAPCVPAAEPEPNPDPAALLAGLWAELLGHAELTGDSDFFELGGDSLLITRLARRVNQELGIQVPLRAMLAGRTLGRQTAIISDLVERAAAPFRAAG
ncbi:type I polyketide synthase [Actinophytocola sp.]|uniref:type I polyketide synthase n=1 Tax=Actinophytocola sp. TaxID=1872138 RepID=UPI002D7E9409|nr:beta-ketoacyl synthase N-terminal-like domain-containing protein [Actinophytocola sp.]HET9138967.1 beta-ketoacyl synthase N-terminal-like domain-containing protein [Actinophytocola sp.]